MNKLLKWLGFASKELPIQFSLNIPAWDDSDAVNLAAFLKTSSGQLFIQHLNKHQLEVNQWATDVSMENYENMKYRSCVAHGGKLKMDHVINLSRVKPENKHKEPSKDDMDKFFHKRMSMFKS